VLFFGVALIGVGALLPGALASRLAPDAPTVAVADRSARGTQPTANAELVWEPFSKESLAAHRAAGHAVFLDFTAEWCVSCKVNERLVLQSESVRRRLRESGVVTMKADWTSYDPRITEALAEFGKSAIPFYAVYARDARRPPVELPAILTPSLVLDAIDHAR
jgi:thiol:disulfide interchange protein DsbD